MPRPCDDCIPALFAKHVLIEATQLAPDRRRTSDGTCGDESHHNDWTTDHNGYPPSCIEHAVDVSNDPGVWDGPQWATEISRRMAHGLEDRIKYIVANFGGADMIFHRNNMQWEQNGSYKTDHRSHTHYSFIEGVEDNTDPFFGAVILPPPDHFPPPVTVRFDMPETKQTEFTVRLDGRGNGFLDVPRTKASAVKSLIQVGAFDPAAELKYPKLVQLALTIAESNQLARVVITEGKPQQVVSVRVVYV